MDRTISDVDARRHLDHLLDDVSRKGDTIIVERDGEPVAVVVPLHLFEQWKSSRDVFFGRFDEMAHAADLSEDEAMALALEAQRAMRAEHGRSGA